MRRASARELATSTNACCITLKPLKPWGRTVVHCILDMTCCGRVSAHTCRFGQISLMWSRLQLRPSLAQAQAAARGQLPRGFCAHLSCKLWEDLAPVGWLWKHSALPTPISHRRSPRCRKRFRREVSRRWPPGHGGHRRLRQHPPHGGWGSSAIKHGRSSANGPGDLATHAAFGDPVDGSRETTAPQAVPIRERSRACAAARQFECSAASFLWLERTGCGQ